MFSRVFDDINKLVKVNEKNGVVSRILGYGPGILMMEWVFPKAGTELPLHNHYHEQMTYVKKGSIKVTLDDSTEKILNEGESVYFAPYENHAIIVLEDGTIGIDVFSPLRIDHLENHL